MTKKEAALEAPLHRALDQSERVKVKVEEAADELSGVNAVLKDDSARGAPLARVQHALERSEAVELKMSEAAQELVAVNVVLADEVAERSSLEDRVQQVEAALSESLAAEELARHRAFRDALTELPNISLFSDRLDNALEQAHRHQWRLAVLFLDLDGFKLINDTHGHDVGDRVLQAVADRLRDATRNSDSVGRRGGDEFLVLMLEMQDDGSAVTLARKICERIAETIVVGGVSLVVGVSVGIAVYPEDASTATELLKLADTAMYAAKKGGLGVARYAAPIPA